MGKEVTKSWKCANCKTVTYIEACVCENPDPRPHETEEVEES